ncbi:MAG: hypothetical protein Q4F00_11590 [bacterium]|nr:hypothetical protein [bacterium]
MVLTFPAINEEDFPQIVPPLRTLIEELADCDAKGLPLHTAEVHLRACDLVLSAFFEGYKISLTHYDYDAKEIEMIAVGFAIFERLGQIFTLTYRSLNNDEHDLTVLNVITIIESLRQLENILSEQRKYRYSKPKLSEATGLDEILRAGKAVVEGRRDWTQLISLLERLRPAAEAMCSNPNNPPSVEAHCTALEQLFNVTANKLIEELPQALENLKVTGEAFLAVDFEAERASNAPGFACPICGAKVPQWDKKCPSCNAKMPDRSYEQDVLPTEVFELPKYLDKATAAAEKLREGSISFDEFYAKVQAVIDNVSYVNSRLTGMAVYNSDSSAEECQLAQNLHDMLTINNDYLSHAVEYFQALGQTMESEMLDAGMEYFISGVDGMRQAALEARKLERLRGCASAY